MRSKVPMLLFLAAFLPAAHSAADEPDSRALWRVSVAGVAAASVLDVHSSWGKRELNGALAGPAGTFGARGTAVKSGMQAAMIACEYLLIRKHPRQGRLYRAAAAVNFIAAGVAGATAARNYGIARR